MKHFLWILSFLHLFALPVVGMEEENLEDLIHTLYGKNVPEIKKRFSLEFTQELMNELTTISEDISEIDLRKNKALSKKLRVMLSEVPECQDYLEQTLVNELINNAEDEVKLRQTLHLIGKIFRIYRQLDLFSLPYLEGIARMLSKILIDFGPTLSLNESHAITLLLGQIILEIPLNSHKEELWGLVPYRNILSQRRLHSEEHAGLYLYVQSLVLLAKNSKEMELYIRDNQNSHELVYLEMSYALKILARLELLTGRKFSSNPTRQLAFSDYGVNQRFRRAFITEIGELGRDHYQEIHSGEMTPVSANELIREALDHSVQALNQRFKRK